jgi:hypothetical protein
MAVHFNFVVTDTEAEIILQCVNNEIVKCIGIQKTMTYQTEKDWTGRHINLLKDILAKMKNTWVSPNTGV